MYALIRPLLFSLPEETAHNLSLHGLSLAQRLGLLRLLFPAPISRPEQTVQLMGLNFPHPLGLAAGLDKNAECIDAFASLGFGFVEVGTVTPRPQPGNPKPRLFRLPEAEAVINRMGFNNEGVDALLDRVKKRRSQTILGINLGKNFDTPLENALDDYLIGLRKVYAAADYITINISSPNTPGLRQLQHGEALSKMLAALKAEQSKLADEQGRNVPIVVKIAPDLTSEELKDIAERLVSEKMDGVIATNTTFSRVGVEGLPHAEEQGGLSGAPLFEHSTEIVRQLYAQVGDDLPIIAAGGISNATQAQAKLDAGARLVQVYSGFLYKGPALISEIVSQL